RPAGALDVLAHLQGTGPRRPQDEAPASRKLVELPPQRVGRRHHLALPPLHVGRVFALEARPGRPHRRGVRRAPGELLDARNLGVRRETAALALGDVQPTLTLEL